MCVCVCVGCVCVCMYTYAHIHRDGVRMAKDVMNTVQELLQSHGNMNAAEAKQFVKDMIKTNTYVQDIWS